DSTNMRISDHALRSQPAPARVSHSSLTGRAFVLTRPLGATLGDLLTKPTAKGGLAYGTAGASAILLGALVLLVSHGYRRQTRTAAR
ncbi:hypothetical protein E7Y31_19565, partial [Candidatus Frankia alpina]